MPVLPLVAVAILFLIAIFTLMVGALDDLRTREVSSYLFVPLFLASLILFSIYGFKPLPMILSSALFLLTFFRLKPVFYVLGGIAVLFASFALPANWHLYFIVLFILYMLGTGERYFGIGDIKAFISLSFAFSFSQIPYIFPVSSSPLTYLIPFNFTLLMDTAICSILAIPVILIANMRRSKDLKLYHTFAMDYDEEIYRKNPERYKLAEISGRKVMLYGIPTLLPIYAGFLLAFAFGPWFL